MRLPTFLAVACLGAVFLMPGGSGTASTCRSMGGFPLPSAEPTGKVPGPWPNVLQEDVEACAYDMYFTSTAPSCGSAVEAAVGGQWCDMVWPGGTAAYPKTCTVANGNLVGVNLKGIAVGWDYGGPPAGYAGEAPAPYTYASPQGPRDGNVDGWDIYAPDHDMRWTKYDYAGRYTVFTDAPSYVGQLIAYPIATSVLVPPNLLELLVDCV